MQYQHLNEKCCGFQSEGWDDRCGGGCQGTSKPKGNGSTKPSPRPGGGGTKGGKPKTWTR